ncbi:hypothetical protein ABGT16_04695 [Pseudomonas asiatica]|uniref:hypothetical protein n=1 Tax=Pseudomonas asiatica TaxID=2219225 RepID=UPI00345D2AA4
MHATQEASDHLNERISRAELFQGDTAYWSTCRADAAEAGMYGPMMMPYAIPGDMLDSKKAEAAWAYWYGSLKDARKAANLSSRRLTEFEATHNQKLEELSPFTRLSRRIDLDQMRLAADDTLAGAGQKGAFKLHTQERMPLLLLDRALEQQIGPANCQQIKRLAMAAPAPELAEMVESEFPFMRALHQQGAFLRSTCQHLLALACLIQTIKADACTPAAEKLMGKLLITCLVRTLPARIGILAAVTSPEIASCFDWPCRFSGVCGHDLLDGDDIWALVPAGVLQETSNSLKAFTFPTYSDPVINELVQRLDVLAIAGAAGEPVALDLNAVHQDLLTKAAVSMQDELKLFLEDGGVFFAAQPYQAPQELVRPGFSLVMEGREKAVAEALFSVILSTHFAGPIQPLRAKVADYKLSLEKNGKKIVDYSRSGSSKLVAKINGIGKKCQADLDSGRVWFVDEAMRLKGLISAWGEFYEQLASLQR